ncbi:Hypothetical_protein [Hexamita inflata]|uniref:Hypothetical_protein n=1 Tax=Hexamita inflata TaxID=28002 RepID=A0AA86US34_9EUKA|nr:Hypothetical protein HINF_LOCUS57150 [Hexamita inflata]
MQKFNINLFIFLYIVNELINQSSLQTELLYKLQAASKILRQECLRVKQLYLSQCAENKQLQSQISSQSEELENYKDLVSRLQNELNISSQADKELQALRTKLAEAEQTNEILVQTNAELQEMIQEFIVEKFQ